MPQNLYFDQVFANSGDLVAVPDTTQSSGTVSYEQGYPIGYSTPVASGGFNFPRAQHNQILNDVTAAVQFIQRNGAANFITTAMNGGTPYSYNLGATCVYNAGGGTQVWLSIAAANTTTPGAMGAHWVALAIPSSTLFTGGTSAGSANAQAVTTNQGDFTNSAGNIVTWKAGVSVTGASTLQPDSASAVTLKVPCGSGLRDTQLGDIIANQECMAISDGTFLQLMGAASARKQVSGAVNFYVATTGSDSNPGTFGSPFLTIQHAVNVLLNQFDGNGFSATINVADGTYTSGAVISQPFVGFSLVTLSGNTTTPANCIISTTSADCIQVVRNGLLAIQGFKLTTASGGNGLDAGQGGYIIVAGNMNFGSISPGNSQVVATYGGEIDLNANYTISGSAPTHWAASQQGRIQTGSGGISITVTGTPAFTAFAALIELGYIRAASVVFSGSATGDQYTLVSNSVLSTNGGYSSFPGSGTSVGTGCIVT